jgi:beta-glucosidase
MYGIRTYSKTTVISLLLLLFITAGPAAQNAKPLYKDPSQPVEKRVDDLLGRMTLEEKVAQMLCLWWDKNKILNDSGMFDATKAPHIIPHGIGSIARPSDLFGRAPGGVIRGPRETVLLVNSIQHYMIDKTRLGIPVLFHEEGLHGYMAKDATSFPQAIALAGTWNPTLIEQVYTCVAAEMRARGVFHALSPVVDVARDPRWGRIEETFGEDPFLAGAMGVAAVRGFQGTKLPLGEKRVAATLKHMTGHGQPESGLNTAPAAVPQRMLREVFLPPFERAIHEAGALSVMASYNEIDGIPSHANRFLLTDILRNEWGFSGVVVADYNGIGDLVARHRVAPTIESAALQSLDAGVDIELPDRNAYPALVSLVKNGSVTAADIDKAVRRILHLKFITGQFDHPFADTAAAERITGNAEARALALKAAQEAIVLLKNKGNLLPIDPAKCKRIVVTGPNAAETILGGYSDVPRRTVSILDGIKARLGSNVAVDFCRGVDITQGRSWFEDKVTLASREQNLRLIADAVKMVKGADYAIVAVGENESTCREGWSDGHLGDRSSLDLVGEQDELVKAIVATGVPTIVVLINGRPLSINYIADNVPATLEGWYLGQETGTAVAGVLFGDVNPGGKLPLTIPQSAGQLPMFYNKKPTARRGYLFGTVEPLYPFGYGLSYTTFKLEKLRLSASEIAATDSVNVLVDIINTGRRTGDETVQLYVNDKVASVTRPVKELKAFRRCTLKPGERRTITFTLPPSTLAFYDRLMKRVVEPGEFEIMVGPNSVETVAVTLKVTGK